MASEIKAELMKIPPVTRFLCAAQLAVTLPVLLQLIPAHKVVLYWPLVIKQYEIWRIATSFFLGGSGINFIFDIAMLYRNSDGLESQFYSRRSADYAWQLMVAAGGIMALSYPIGAMVFTRPLLIALTYLSSQLSPPGAQSSLFGLVTMPVIYYPYIMVGMDLLMSGPAAAAGGVVGLVVGHGWWWGVFGGPGGRGHLERWGSAPAWLKTIVSDGPPQATNGSSGTGAGAGGEAPRPAAPIGPVGGVHVIAPRARTAGSSATTTGYQWGSGQRLGEN